MVDAADLKSVVRKDVRVRVPPRALSGKLLPQKEAPQATPQRFGGFDLACPTLAKSFKFWDPS